MNHAAKVINIAKDYFKLLNSKNIFKPKALAKVLHREKWSVGSSVAVSEFLRPLCLYTRIASFKQNLTKAIALNQPLHTEDDQNWSSSAWAFEGENHDLRAKPPCQNCTMMFEPLAGFIQTSEQGGSGTFLGACAEYGPVDQLLAVEALTPEENQWIKDQLKRNRDQCTVLYRNFRDIENRCNEVVRKNQRELRNMKFKVADLSREIREKVHIFVVKPECNMYFGGRN